MLEGYRAREVGNGRLPLDANHKDKLVLFFNIESAFLLAEAGQTDLFPLGISVFFDCLDIRHVRSHGHLAFRNILP